MTEDEFYQWRTCEETALILGVSGRTVRRAVTRGDMLARLDGNVSLYMPVECTWTSKTLLNCNMVLKSTNEDRATAAATTASLDQLNQTINELKEEVHRLRAAVEDSQQSSYDQAHTSAQHPLSFASLIIWVWSWLKIKLEHIRRSWG